MAEGGVGMLTNPKCWWYYKMQLILQESKMTGILANDDWWYTKVQQLLVESNSPALEITCRGKASKLLETFKKKQGLLASFPDWWDIQLQQLIDIIVFPGMVHEYWWYNRIKLLLLESNGQGILVGNDKQWWCNKVRLLLDKSYSSGHKGIFQVEKLLEKFNGLQVIPFGCSTWWGIKLKDLIDTVDLPGMQFDPNYWWYTKMQLLLLESNMPVLDPLTGIMVGNDKQWWCNKVKLLLDESYRLDLQIDCRDRVNQLLQNFNGLQAGILVNYSGWWNHQLQNLIDNIVFPEILVDIGASWSIFFAEFKTKFKELSRFVYEERYRKTVYPPADRVFSWTNICGINGIYDVKVVILGQDPYHGPNQADGLAFSVQEGPIPPSLEHIYAEIQRGYPEFQHPGHGSLQQWAKRGVLLVNTCLTVRKGKAHSHQSRGWEIFIEDVISWFIINRPKIAFMLWGTAAQSIKNFICNDPVLYSHKIRNGHEFFEASHPGTQSYKCTDKPFYLCNHFYLVNQFLNNEIDWINL